MAVDPLEDVSYDQMVFVGVHFLEVLMPRVVVYRAAEEDWIFEDPVVFRFVRYICKRVLLCIQWFVTF